ncbi:MAG: hypothetical protein QNJ14_10290 [Woeseiaceae bacterium]|nr:hypothetical protein [Woeseiaceae bacterium]
MTMRTILIAAFALSVIACAREDAPEPVGPAPSTLSAAEETSPWKTTAFIQHMHRHAMQIDRLNLALAEGDFDSAMTPAYWLSRHDEIGDIPSELQRYVEGMREAAREVEASTDFDTARTAAERITVQCQGCHSAANVDTGV